MTYTDLMDAIKILDTAMRTILRDNSYVGSPAWDMIFNAQKHLKAQAFIALRGE